MTEALNLPHNVPDLSSITRPDMVSVPTGDSVLLDDPYTIMHALLREVSVCDYRVAHRQRDGRPSTYSVPNAVVCRQESTRLCNGSYAILPLLSIAPET